MKRCFELAAEGKLEELKPLLAAGHHQRRAKNERGKTLLHVAAESGQKDVAQHLLELARSSVDVQDNDGNTALHLAVLNNHVEVADLLLASGASAVIPNHRKVLPFHVALHGGSQSTNMIKAFCKYDIDHLARGFRNYTSLHVIAARNNLTALQLLYEAAVSNQLDIKRILQLQAVDRDGLTPIHLAARKGSYDVLNFIISKAIEHGLKPQNVFRYLSEKESTPLHFAVESNSLEIVRILLEYGASPIAISGKQSTPVHLACSQNKLNMVEEMVEQCGNEILNCKNDQGQTPLHSSSSLMGGKQLISFLLSKGSPLDVQDANGHTPLQVAVRYGNIASMEQLLASGSSPLIKDTRGCNCLHIAVTFKRREVFKCLLKHPKITEMSNSVNNDGDLPIHLALREGLSTFITPLLTSTHHQITDKDDNNYFHLAALAGDDKTVENLLTRSFAESMINATNSSGKTPLHCSAISGNLACIYLLLDHGAMVNKCHCGRTPFMYACSEGRLQSSKVLYEAHPFQRDWKDDQGSTALHLAAKSGSSEVTNYCLDVGVIVNLDNEQNSFFDIIIDAINSKLAISVLQHQRWQECLDTSCPTKPHPVMRLINLIPSAFPVILDQSIQRSPLDPKHKDYWEKYDFKYISLPLGPPITNAANVTDVNLDKDDSMESTTQTSARKSTLEDKSSSGPVQPEVQLQMETLPGNEKSTKAPKEGNLELETPHAIQQSTISDGSTTIDKEEKTMPAQDVHTDHQSENNDGGRSDGVPTMKVLKLLAKNQQKQCLTHPLVTKYLFLKWVDYARTLYVSKCLLILLMAIFLSTFIGISPIPSQLDLTTVDNETAISDVSNPEISTAANIIRFVTIFFAILNGILWLATIYVLRLKLITHFVKEFEFWLYGSAIITTLIYLIPFSGLNSVIYEAGAIAVFTTWIVALLQIELFGVVGIYISMLISTTKNVLKVLAVCFFLFCAFAFAFHILVGSISELQFTNIGISLVSSISSALAIVDLNTFVALESSLRFRILVFIFYVLLLIILPIVVINLLIGLAVGDIAKIQEDAEIDRQIFIVTNLSKIDEHLLPRKVVLQFHRESYVHYPNNFGETWLTQVWRKFLHLLSACSDQAITIQPDEEESSLESREEGTVTLEECHRQIQLLAQTQAKQIDTLTRMEVMLQKLMKNQHLNDDN